MFKITTAHAAEQSQRKPPNNHGAHRRKTTAHTSENARRTPPKMHGLKPLLRLFVNCGDYHYSQNTEYNSQNHRGENVGGEMEIEIYT